MCDSDFYEPIEGLPSVCEHLYTYYLWAPDGTTPPDDKHVVINNWNTIHHHICCDKFPQITIATSHLSQEEAKEIALSMFRLSASDVFFWSGGLRCKLDRKDYQAKLLSKEEYNMLCDSDTKLPEDTQERSIEDKYMSYAEAIELCKKGVTVACELWSTNDFISFKQGTFTRYTSHGTYPHNVEEGDAYSEKNWLLADYRVKANKVEIRERYTGSYGMFFSFDLDSAKEPTFKNTPFANVYDVLCYLHPNITVIGAKKESNLPNIVSVLHEVHLGRKPFSRMDYPLDKNGMLVNDTSKVFHYVIKDIEQAEARIVSREFPAVIVDTDSFGTQYLYKLITDALTKAGVKWVAVSVIEEVRNGPPL